MASNLRSASRPPRKFLLLLPFLSLLFGLSLPQTVVNDFQKTFCEGNFTVNSTYQENLNSLLRSISSDNSSTNGFYHLSSGQSPDQVFGIALCRADVSLSDCQTCIKNSSLEIVEKCHLNKQAFIFYDNCMLRYSDQTIFGVTDTFHVFWTYNPSNATQVTEFDQKARELMKSLRIRAMAGNSTLKFAAGRADGPDSLIIYGLAQCTPDMSETLCGDCLITAIDDFNKCCVGRIGARVVSPNCNMRYEVNRFYDPSAEAISATNSTGKNRHPVRTIIIVVVSIAGVCLLVLSVFCIRRRKVAGPVKNDENPFLVKSSTDEIMTEESLHYDFETVRAATHNFSEENKLGQGGFGAVYKGMVANGQEIAVKRLSRGHGQGDQEFKNEVILMARLQHRNLVRLLGFSLSGEERLLIYEFLPTQASTGLYLRQQLEWERRRKIIGGIARGLTYLHEDSQLRIIHRDLKAANVLLDAEMNPKISDFGTARLFVSDKTHSATNNPVGTYGYMAPEYVLNGQFSVKSDVFSFGILVLEIISGQKATHCSRNGESAQDLQSFAWRNWRGGTVSNIIDPSLGNEVTAEIQRHIHIGLLCVQGIAANRPNMSSILTMLNSYSVSLAVPSQPALFVDSSESGAARDNSTDANSDESNGRPHQGSVNEVSITDVVPR